MEVAQELFVMLFLWVQCELGDAALAGILAQKSRRLGIVTPSSVEQDAKCQRLQGMRFNS